MRTIRSFTSSNHQILTLIPALLIGLFFIWMHASTHPWNSDHLYLEAIYRDLTTGTAPIREFHFSASTFLLPDSLIYLPLRMLTDNLGLVLFGFMVIQLIGLLLLLSHLAGDRSNALYFAISTLVFFGLLDSHWLSILYPVHHGTQWVWGMLLLIRMDPLKHFRVLPMIIGGLVSAGIVSSDLLFGFTGLGPYVLWSIERSWRRSAWKDLKTIVIWSALSFLAILGAYFLFRYLTGSYFGWNKPLPGLILDRTRMFFVDFFSLKSSLGMIAGLFYLVWFRKSIEPAGLLSNSIIFSFAAVIATGVWTSPENVRYIQPVGFSFAWVAGIWISGISSRIYRGIILIALMAFSIPQLLKESRKFQQFPLEQPYLAAHACLDRFILESGLNEGIGDYWSAKWLTFFSKQNGKVLQVTPELEPFYWINNHVWYRDFVPRFVIMNFFSSSRITPEEIHMFGRPSKVVSCPGFDIWVYPAGMIRLKTPTPPKHLNFQEFRD